MENTKFENYSAMEHLDFVAGLLVNEKVEFKEVREDLQFIFKTLQKRWNKIASLKHNFPTNFDNFKKKRIKKIEFKANTL